MTSNTSLRERAERHASLAQWPEALACFEALLKQRPNDADVLLQLSYVSSLSGQYREGRRYALLAASAPHTADQVQELVARLRTFNEVSALRACLSRWGPAAGLPIPVLLAFAAHLGSLNDEQAALQLLDVAKSRDPTVPFVLMLRGQTLLHLGRFDEAEADLLACVRLAPMLGRTWGLLASLGRRTVASKYVDVIRKQLAAPTRSAQDVAELGFALHRMLDDLGDHAGAWNALQLGSQAKRGLLQYSSQESVDLVDALLAASVQLPGPERLDQTDGSTRTPIFIVGMHRSGTTLLEQLLHGHPDVQGLGELYDFTSSMRDATNHHCRGVIDRTLVQRASGVDFNAVGRSYLNGLSWRLGTERAFVDKLPSNFFNVGFICRALPQARILHMRRDPMETCFSNLRELFADANPYSYDQRELGDFYLQYRRLMEHWHQTLPGRMLDVDYTGLVNDTESTMRQVAQFCGLSFDPSMLSKDRKQRSVSTASAVSVRQPIGSRLAPRWAPYATQLQPLKDALALS